MADHSFEALEEALSSLSLEIPVPEAKYGQLDDLLSKLRFRLISAQGEENAALQEEVAVRLVASVCAVLRPSASLLRRDMDDDEEDEDEKPPSAALARFRELSTTALSVLSALLSDNDILSSNGSLLSPLAVALATYSDPSDPWTSESACEASKSFPYEFSQDTLVSILSDDIKPFFTTRPGTITAQGRKAIRPAPQKSSAASYFDDEIPWKKKVETVTVLCWCVTRMDKRAVDRYWNMVVPPLLTVLDHGADARALAALDVLLSKMDEDLLRRTGLDGVIWDAGVPCLGYLPPITPLKRSMGILDAAFTLLRRLATIRGNNPPPPNKKTPLPPAVAQEEELKTKQYARSAYLSTILRAGILQKQQYISENVYIQRIYMRHLSSIVNGMGIYSARHLTPILTLITSVLAAPFATAYLPLLLEACSALQEVIRVCWPRMPQHAGVVLRGVTMAWLRVGEEEGLMGADEVREALKKCVVLLAEATQPDGGIHDSVQRIVEKEAECSGLFAGVVSA